jgi:hypothetical protein
MPTTTRRSFCGSPRLGARSMASGWWRGTPPAVSCQSSALPPCRSRRRWYSPPRCCAPSILLSAETTFDRGRRQVGTNGVSRASGARTGHTGGDQVSKVASGCSARHLDAVAARRRQVATSCGEGCRSEARSSTARSWAERILAACSSTGSWVARLVSAAQPTFCQRSRTSAGISL